MWKSNFRRPRHRRDVVLNTGTRRGASRAASPSRRSPSSFARASSAPPRRSRRSRPPDRARAATCRSRARRAALFSRACSTTSRPRCRRRRRRRPVWATLAAASRRTRSWATRPTACRSPARSTRSQSPRTSACERARVPLLASVHAFGTRPPLSRSHFHAYPHSSCVTCYAQLVSSRRWRRGCSNGSLCPGRARWILMGRGRLGTRGRVGITKGNYYAEEAFISRQRQGLYSARGIRRAADPRIVVVAAATQTTKTESRATTRSPTPTTALPTVRAPAGPAARARATAAAP